MWRGSHPVRRDSGSWSLGRTRRARHSSACTRHSSRHVESRARRFLPHGRVRRFQRRCRSGPGPFDNAMRGETTMRVIVFVKANRESEAGQMPTTDILARMGKYNEELVKAGVMLAGEGLYPSAKGKRVRFSGSQHTV